MLSVTEKSARKFPLAHRDARIDRDIECAGHAEIFRWHRVKEPAKVCSMPAAVVLCGGRLHRRQARQDREKKHLVPM